MKTLQYLIVTIYLLCRPACAQDCGKGVLDARVKHALNTFLSDLPSSQTVSVEQIRNVRVPVTQFPRADLKEMKITSDSIAIQVYNPDKRVNLPIIIYYHPGGFVTPMLAFMQYECWRQARLFGAVVIAVDYRVAPEHPFPAAVDDSYNAFKWISENGGKLGGDASKIIVEGLSAGGNLAAVVCQKAKLDGLAGKIKLQVLNCPSTDNPRNNHQYESYQRYASGYFLTKAFCEYYICKYATNQDLDNPDIAPVRRDDLRGLPAAVIFTAEFDPLRDEAQLYADRLAQAGVKVSRHCFAGQIHCLLGLPPGAVEQNIADHIILTSIRKVSGN